MLRSSPSLERVGPLYSRSDANGLLVLGLRVLDYHCNAGGTAHGGPIGTVVDVALGYATAFSREPPVPMTTVSLRLDFTGPVRLGDWLEVHTRVHKVGRRLAFADAQVLVGKATAACASAVFQIHTRVRHAADSRRTEQPVTRHSDARDRIVRATAALLASKGYFGTGLNEIITRSDAPKGSLYHYFPAGKTAMVSAALEFVGTEVAALLERSGAEAPHARNQLQAFARILRSWLQESDFNESCPVFATTVNLGVDLPDVQQASLQALGRWRNCFEVALGRDGLDESSARAQAYLLVAALEGALGLARLERSTSPLDLVERQLLASLPA